MKKFIMTSPFQMPKSVVYEAADNAKLQYDKAVHFPILPVIHGYAKPGEDIQVIVILSAYENAQNNMTLLRQELDALCGEMQVHYQIDTVDIPYDSTLDTHLSIFSQLIDKLGDGDSIYVCTTYGTKATPLVEMLTLNYTYRMHRNVEIGCIVYAATDFAKADHPSKIYDITSLFYMDDMIRTLADSKVKQPEKIIRTLLDE